MSQASNTVSCAPGAALRRLAARLDDAIAWLDEAAADGLSPELLSYGELGAVRHVADAAELELDSLKARAS
ncbi:MAG: hypothetical protein IT303_11645 [Dehalococcoidia bacterium]|nr:hypothetical protein [Dehalococcoidia bacterium]